MMSIKNLIKNAESVDIFKDISEYEQKEFDLKSRIAAAILNERYNLRMNQTRFADYMNVSQSLISKWESGEYNCPCDSLELVLYILGLRLSLDEEEILKGKHLGVN